MTLKNYLLTVVVVSTLWVIALLTLPAFARFVEQLMLAFLSSTAG